MAVMYATKPPTVSPCSPLCHSAIISTTDSATDASNWVSGVIAAEPDDACEPARARTPGKLLEIGAVAIDDRGLAAGLDRLDIHGQVPGCVDGAELTGRSVELGMRAEGLALPAATGVPDAAGLQRDRIDLVGQPVFLQRVEFAVMNQWRGVGYRARVRVGRVTH